MKRQPDYKKIYTDMLLIKYPDKIKYCSELLKKENLTLLDVINLNNILISGCKSTARENQKLRSYDLPTIFKILKYQKTNQLNNTQLARHFKLSRNTVAKWKKMFT